MSVVLSTDFTGTDGSAWPGPWTAVSGGTATIQTNRGEEDTPNGAFAATEQRANITVTRGRFDATIQAPDVSNATMRINVRYDPSTGNGYRLICGLYYSGLELRRVDAFSETDIGDSYATAWTAAVDWRVAVEFDGPAIRAKRWLAANPEPSTWEVIGTDATYLSGDVSLVTQSASVAAVVVGTWDNVSVDDYDTTPVLPPPPVPPPWLLVRLAARNQAQWGTTAVGPQTFTQVSTVAVATVATPVRQVGVAKTVSVATARKVARQVGTGRLVAAAVLAVAVPSKTFLRAMAAAVSAGLVLGRRVGVRRTVPVAVSPAVKRALSVRRTAAVAGAVVLRRIAGVKRAVPVAVSRSLARRVGKRATVTAAAVLTLVRALRVAKKVSAAAVAARTVRVGRVLTAAGHAALTLRRQVGAKRTVAVGASLLVRRRIARAVSVAAHAAATLATTRVALLALRAVVTGAVTLRRRVGKRATVTVTVARSATKRLPRVLTVAAAVAAHLARRVGRKLTFAVAAVATQTARRVRLLTLTAAVAAATVLRRRIGRPLPRSVAATSSVARRVGARRTVPVAAVPKLVRRVRRGFAVAAHVAAVLGVARVALLALHAAVAAAATLRRQIPIRRAAAVAAAATIRRRVGAVRVGVVAVTTSVRRLVRARLAGAVAAAAAARRRIGRRFAAAAHVGPTNTLGRLYRQAFTVAVDTATSLATAATAARQLVFTFGRGSARWVTALLPGRRWLTRAKAAKWTFGGPQVLTYSVLSKELVQVTVAATAGGSPVNPTADVVQFAFVAAGASPTSGDWHNGSWDSNPANGVYVAECLIGPGGTVALPVGVYAVWVKVVDSPEVPVRQVDSIQIV